jgi:hypothetical protein
MGKVQLSIWNDEITQSEISKRFRNASDARRQHEDRWLRNERTIYSSRSSNQTSAYLSASLESNFNIGLPGVDSSNAEMCVSYAFKNLRFIHAQMSSNPPSVVMRPTSSDQEDHRKADAADRVVRFAIRHYNMQEKIDQMSLNCLLYGTGALKTIWDESIGDILEYNEESQEILLEGDISVTVPFMWNLFPDPDARSADEIKWVVEKIYMDYNEALLKWPTKADVLKKALIEKKDTPLQLGGRDSQLNSQRYNCVELLEYWETGLPSNGYMGRYSITTTNGEVVEPCRPSPFRFRQPGAVTKIEQSNLPEEMKQIRIQKVPEKALLPYHFLTDIDVSGTFWGKSMLEYAGILQENLNRLDSAVLDNIEAHGVARIILPESSDVADDGLSNSPWDVTKISGNQPPYFMKPPEMMPDMVSTRVNLIQGINDVMGVNESMFGQQSREQAAVAMQFATNQGNMIRRRLFNKYVLAVESVYKAILNLICKHWDTTRKISVVGKEKALEVIELSGKSIDGGYDVVGEYGVSLSLDPMTRKQEVLTLQPLFEKAGIPARTSLRMMKLAELEGLQDKLDLAGARQKEIFDEMIAAEGKRYIAPEPFRDHENMIAWALDYFMTSEYTMLSKEVKVLCEQHIKDRVAMAASEKSQMAPSAPAPDMGMALPAPAAPVEMAGG